MNLASIDLNLLVAFDILIKEQNLSRAADKLGLTQPAMSKRLVRLRSLLYVVATTEETSATRYIAI